MQSADGLTWTLTIRKDVRFQDGTKLEASHIRDAILAGLADQRLVGPAVCLRDIAGVTIAAPNDVVIRLRQPCSFLLDDLEVEIAHTGSDGTKYGTGPFRTVVATMDEATFDRHPGYYGVLPDVDRVVVKSFANLRAPWAEMMRGRVDLLLEVSTEGLEFLRDQSTISVWSYSAYKPLSIVLNSARPSLAPAEVRRALSEAVDRKELLERGLRGRGTLGDIPLWPHYWALASASHPPVFDQAHARMVLSRGKPLTITCLLPETMTGFERLALLLQRQWRAVGVDLRLESLPFPELYRRVVSGDYDAAMIDPLGGPRASFQYRFWHSPDARGLSWNMFGYRSQPVDAALDAMRVAVDEPTYVKAVARYADAVRNDPPLIILAWPIWNEAISSRFEIPPSATGWTLSRYLHELRLKEGRR